MKRKLTIEKQQFSANLAVLPTATESHNKLFKCKQKRKNVLEQTCHGQWLVQEFTFKKFKTDVLKCQRSPSSPVVKSWPTDLVSLISQI